MTRLFVERLLIAPEAPATPGSEYVYDKTRSLNVDAAGLPAVAAGGFGDTLSQTYVDTEKEDRDAVEGSALDTVTKVRTESADADAMDFVLGTETRQVPNEREDFARDLDGGTRTSVKREADDFARDETYLPWRQG